MRETKQSLRINANTTDEGVKSHCKALQRQLMAQVRRLQDAVKTEAKQKLSVLQTQLDGMERAKGTLETALASATRFKDHDPATDHPNDKPAVMEGLAWCAFCNRNLH